MSAAVLAALWFLSPVFLLGVAVIVALLAFHEYAGIAGRAGARVSKPAAGVATAVVCVAVGMPGLPIEVALAGVVLGLCGVVLGRGAGGEGEAVRDAALAAFAPLYIGLPLGLLAATRWTLGRETALLLIATVASSDTLQYYCGRLFGRHPLAPAISPKKTIEGAIGGFAGGAIGLALLGHWWLPDVPLPWRIALGLAVAAAGIAGDLFESLLKRSVGVKDSSAIIPGHGGVLDRIDALLFAAPVFYVFVRYRF